MLTYILFCSLGKLTSVQCLVKELDREDDSKKHENVNDTDEENRPHVNDNYCHSNNEDKLMFLL